MTKRENRYGKKDVPKGYHVHHIDWNHQNNNPNNLIVIHPVVHTVIHQCSVLDKETTVKLSKIFDLSKEHNKDEIMELLKNDPELKCIDLKTLSKLKKKSHPKFDSQNLSEGSDQLEFEF